MRTSDPIPSWKIPKEVKTSKVHNYQTTCKSGMTLEEVSEAVNIFKNDEVSLKNRDIIKEIFLLNDYMAAGSKNFSEGKISNEAYQRLMKRLNLKQNKLLSLLSTDDENKMIKYSESRKKNLSFSLKSVLIIIMLIILFLVALNGRYERLGDNRIIDKWKKVVYLNGTKEFPIMRNGELINNK